jgi:hypothetical protein
VVLVAVAQGVTHPKPTQVELESQDKVTLVELTIIQQARFHQAAVAVNQQQGLTEHLVLVAQAVQE